MNPDQPLSLIHPAQLAEIARLAREAPPGPLVEVGVYRGGSAWHLLRIAREQGRILHLYDTFTGIAAAGVNDRHGVGDFGDVSFYEVTQALSDPQTCFHVGEFPATLGPFPDHVSFVHVDCDQEITIDAAIAGFWPRLVVGGIMLFDDYPYLEGARLAVERNFLKSELKMTDGDRYYAVKRRAQA